MYRHGKDLQARWDEETTAFVVDALLRGRPTSPHGTVEGRVDLRGVSLEQPERVRINENLARLTKVYEFASTKLRGVDLSYAMLPELRLLETQIDDCIFDHARLPSLRTYSAQFLNCSFRFSSLKGAALGARIKDRKPGSQYLCCDFMSADLRKISTESGRFVNCSFQSTQWKDTRTMSAVFDGCDFRGASLEEVSFDGRQLGGSRRSDSLGENKLKDCDFSTAKLDGVAFIAIDFRNCIPPTGDGIILIDHFPARCRAALAALRGMSGEDARAAEAILSIEADEAELLSEDAAGILDLNNYSDGRRAVISTAFNLA